MRTIRFLTVSALLVTGVLLLWDRGPCANAVTAGQPRPGLIYRENASTLNMEAQSLMRDARYEEAAETLQRAIRLNPFSAYTAVLYNNLGKVYEQLGKPTLAISAYQYSSRFQPNFAVPLDNLVLLWERQRLLPIAIEQLQSVVKRMPSQAQAWYLLGLCAHQANNKPLRDKAWSAFLILNPRSGLKQRVCSLGSC